MIQQESTKPKKSVGVLTGDHHYTTFLKIRGYNFKIQFHIREHFNSRGRSAQPGKKKKTKKNPKKPNHKSHLLILHKLPYKSSCLSPTPNDMSEQDSSFNGPGVDASDQTSRHLPFISYKTNNKH